MSTAILGSGIFLDLYAPLKGKSEWGMDTLTRKLTGARSLAAAFIATLRQGDPYGADANGNGAYFLQTWDADDDPVKATITLNYKGLQPGGTPVTKATTQIVSSVGQTEADFSTEGEVGGFPQGRLYRHDLVWSVTSSDTLSDFGTTVKGFRDRYALSARFDFTYRAVQTTYLYITLGRPAAPRYTAPDIPHASVVERGRITLNDGTILPKVRAAGFNLVPVIIDENISFEAVPVIGSPFFECTDVARRTLGKITT